MGFLTDTVLIFRRQLRLSLRNPAWVIIGASTSSLFVSRPTV